MHQDLPKIYYFINQFDPNHINQLDKNIALIYRNYKSKIDKKLIIKIKNYCKLNKRKFLLANNWWLAIKLHLDGVYIPSFNKSLNHKSYLLKKKFIVVGSAHNLKEVREKERQGVQAIFISSLFNKNKKFLGINKLKILIKFTKKKIMVLGGINKTNLNKIKLINAYGFAAIDYFNQLKKNGPSN